MQEQEQPQTKVLTTPELLEIILLHLDTRTLLVSAPRVCRTWTVLIQSSPAIQQALFFQQTTPKSNLEKGKWHAKSIWNSILPSPKEKDTQLGQESTNGYECPHPPPIYNPLLVQAFRSFFPSVHEYPPIHDNDEKANEIDPDIETEHGREEKKKKNPFSFKSLEMLSSPQKKTAYMRKEASWRKMLLCQPPVYGGVTVFKMHHRMGGDSYICYNVPRKSQKTTLRMGHFFTTLTQSPGLYFGRFGLTRVYWSAYVPPYELSPDSRGGGTYPPHEGSYDPTVIKAFAKAVEKSEIVVFSKETIQCSVGRERELTDEESLREEIAEAEIEGSKGGGK